MVAVQRPVKAELVHRLKDALVEALQTNIAEDDDARADILTIGKYTGERDGIVVSVHAEHPLGHDMGRFDHTSEGTPRSREERPWRFPIESIGGSKWGFVYGTIEIRLLKEDMAPADAVEVIETLKARVYNVLSRNASLEPLSDPYGHTLFGVEYYAAYGYASGGDDVSVDAYWIDYTARTSAPRLAR